MDPLDITAPKKDISQNNVVSDELTHVNREMYLKNLELAERNKTLSLLRKIDAVILSTVTDIQQIAQQVANNVVDEADYIKLIVILLYDKKDNFLFRLATSQTENIRKAELEVNSSFHDIKIPLNNEQNIVIQAIKEKRMKRTNALKDVLPSSISADDAQKIQDIIGNSSSLIYPLFARDEIIGGMIIGIDEKEKPLSFYRIDLIDRLPGIVAISIDNGQLYQELHAANEQLKQLDKLKDEFVSLASHELRTPLTAIKSYLWLVLNETTKALDEKQRLYVERSYMASERLIKMVNDMLNISRIESGRLSVTIQQVNLIKLLEEVIAELLPTFQKQSISIVFKPQTTTQFVLADPEKTKGVVINLLGNSIKFTPPNGIITISTAANDGFIKTSISDTGRGISKVDLPKLFQKFEMVGRDILKRQDAKQGTGLGLYIAKSVIELMGGAVWAESEGEDKGATFNFTLKVSDGVTQPSAQTQPSSPPTTKV